MNALGVMDREQLAKEFGVSERTLIRWESDIGLPRAIIGGRVYYRLESVRKWVESWEDVQEKPEKPARRNARAPYRPRAAPILEE